ncbi:MAG: transporter substrate-binding domain-containing protein [Oscillospiraceae bacterium]|nr:transporter substrate-binding domain-containing protein [Oscillospiraceae bacterium]
MKIKNLGTILLAIIILLCISGCAGKQGYQPIDDVSNLEGRTVGVNLVWSADYMLSDREDMTLVRHNTVANLVMALRYGQVDAIAMERPFANEVMYSMSGLRIVEPSTATDELVACVNIDRTDVLEDFNAFASDFYGSEDYIELYDRLNSDSYEYHAVEPIGGEKILQVGIPTDCYPFCYYDSESGEFAGSDVEVITRFANEYGYSLELTGGVFSTIEMGIVNGDFDLAIGTFFESSRVDTELTGAVSLSKPYMQHEIVFMEIEDPDNVKVLIPFDY